MIRKQDILDRAAEWQLRPDIVEKDYVLGWLLAAVGSHPSTRSEWAFKGGTCLKKCFVETYRFSEDLDFTLGPGAPYDEDVLRGLLRGLAETAQEISGITFHSEGLILRERKNRQGRVTWEARLAYRGPLAVPNEPKVRFDLTRHERVVLPRQRRAIFHPYPDDLPPGATVACYALEEVLAEKMRALVERTRPRDLYDVVLILENHSAELNLTQVRDVFAKKCTTKGLQVPSARELTGLASSSAELAAEWENMLAHQLPALPDLAEVLRRLEPALAWLDAKVGEPTRAPWVPLAPARVGRGEPPALVAPRSGTYWGLGQPVEAIRFAGVNRLMVSFVYDGKPRLVEPYSLRRPDTGNLLLFGWEAGGDHIKSFAVEKLGSVQVTNQAFRPRYLVEFAA